MNLNMKDVAQRVEALRKYMSANGFDAFIVVSSDAHSSEYVADRWKSREWISGFDGSAGTAVITRDKALVWTDSRYWLAAEKCLRDSGYELMKDGAAGTPGIVEWLCGNLQSGGVVGVDGAVCSALEVDSWKAALSARGIAVDYSKDPFQELWGDRPSVPLGKAEVMPLELAGATWAARNC